MNTQTNQLPDNDLLVLADEMASAASHFSSHGYDEFVCAREKFVQANSNFMRALKELHDSSQK